MRLYRSARSLCSLLSCADGILVRVIALALNQPVIVTWIKEQALKTFEARKEHLT